LRTVQQRPPRIFFAEDILSGSVSLDGYPWRYVCIGISPKMAMGNALRGRAGADVLMDHILSAAELLEARGWEVFAIDQGGTLVFMRRRQG
jgi:hypothetical protein